MTSVNPKTNKSCGGCLRSAESDNPLESLFGLLTSVSLKTKRINQHNKQTKTEKSMKTISNKPKSMKPKSMKLKSIKPKSILFKSMKLRHLTQSISLALIASTTAQSAEFIVTTTGDSGGGSATEMTTGVFEVDTLRTAIELADNEATFAGPDTIRFAPDLFTAGEAQINVNNIGDTYNTSSSSSDSAFGINSDITIIGPSDDTLRLTAGDLRHFQLNGNAHLSISHLTLDDGFAPPNFTGKGGAVLAIDNSVLNVSHCTFSNNQASSGGAVLIDSDNSSNQSSIEYSRFIENQVSPSSLSVRVGGAVRIDTDNLPFLIRHSTFANNTSDASGGAIFHSSELVVDSSSFYNNIAGSDGGAISGNNQGVLTLINSTISNNQSDIGGGGIDIGTEPGEGLNRIINSTITANQSGANSSPTIQQRLGDEVNFETSGGGIYAYGYLGEDSLMIHNSIITGNTETTAMLPDDVAALIQADSSHNLIGAGDSVLGISDGVNGNQIGTRDVPIDAQLQSLADNGGFTLTQLPSIGSPVIDAGNDGLCESIDQRGRIRPQDGDDDGSPVCDIGAVELGSLEDLIFKDGFN